MKHLALTFFLLIAILRLQGQTETPIDSLENDTTFFQSPISIAIEAEAVVRFETNADIYLSWSPLPSVTSYIIRYKFGEEATTWQYTSIENNEYVIESVPLDISVLWDVTAYDAAEAPIFQSAVGIVKTTPQKEPIEVSSRLYNKLERWFSRDENPEGFCEFFNELEMNQYEKLAFLQAYSFDNAKFVKPSNPSIVSLNSWFPVNAITGSADGDNCISIVGNCNCKVITRGSNIATPNEKLENYKVFPKIFAAPIDTKQRHRLEAGAAKFVSLFQERTGGQTLEMSNVEGTGDNSSVTTQASEIAFFLACMTNNGGITTNLPEACQCERPLHVYYEYATNLHVRSEKKGCCVSRGAEATAEDFAFVALYEGKTGNLSPLSAGQLMISNSCSSNWNPDFWLEIIDLLTPVGQFYLATLGDSDAVPTLNQLTEFANALKTLINTNFTNKSGECGLFEKSSVLVSDSKTLSLKPNNPIRIGLFSSYYVRTRGYGNWKAEAGVASDYYLLGVVESQLTNDPECCSDKYANYIAGSQSSPAGCRYPLHAPNTVENRIDDVGFLLSLYGSWDGYSDKPGTGIIDLLERQYDNKLTGPSCSLNSNEFGDIGDDRGVESYFIKDKISVYPTITSNQLNIEISEIDASNASFEIFDITGSALQSLFSGALSEGSHLLQFELNHLNSGVYILKCQVGVQTHLVKFIIQ
jgi:hypothetical protein